MSVQKLIAEADKLLDRGKHAEAIEKLKAALQTEPMNQLATTKLANAYAATGNKEKAAATVISLANKLSDAGKAQVAIAVFKQALEFTPNDIALKLRYAQECEGVGKVGDAQTQASAVLQHYLRRKRYFDAANILPMLVRLNAKDDRLKLAWLEVMQLSQAEKKLVHLLVALCGPPGLVSQEFTVGGEPSSLNEELYQGLLALVPFFPRDPKIAYAAAWCAYRRGRNRDAFRYLRECLRREPDFCLGILLFARLLSEREKLNEAYFVFRYLKERLPADKSAEDISTLNRLVEAYVEKNGWITFTEQTGDQLTTAQFVQAISGEVDQPAAPSTAPAEAAPPPVPSREEPPSEVSINIPTATREVPAVEARAEEKELELGLPPAEIELGGGAGDFEIERHSESDGRTSAKTKKSPPAEALEKPQQESKSFRQVSAAEALADSIPVTVSEPSPAAESTGSASAFAPVSAAEVLAAAIPVVPSSATSVDIDAASPNDATMVIKPGAATAAAPETTGNSAAFAPVSAAEVLAAAIPAISSGATGVGLETGPAGDATMVIKPGMAQVSAAELLAGAIPVAPASASAVDIASPPANEDATMIVKAPAPAADAPAGASAAPARPTFNPLAHADLPSADNVPAIDQDNEKTEMFSPMDLIGVKGSSSALGDVKTKIVEPTKTQSLPEPTASTLPSRTVGIQVPQTEWHGIKVDNKPTEIFSPLEVLQAQADSRKSSAPLPGDATRVIPEAQAPVAQAPDAADPTQIITGEPPAADSLIEELRGQGVMPIPGAAEPLQLLDENGEKIDLGEDLLEGATRILLAPTKESETKNLINEIKREGEKQKDAVPAHALLMKKAERFIAKRNYYLARKALRHAQTLGADEEAVKKRLGDIRKLEMPNSLYHAVSSDGTERERSSDILERLEREFDISDDIADGGEIEAGLESRLEEVFQQSDARTMIDFGVGLHEMGLFRQAELVFSRVVSEFPEMSFDAYYLAAVSKFSRKDYAGAASILKKLSADVDRTDQEKIQIYYALGELFEKMSQPDRSREFFRKVAELDANYRNIRHKLEE